MTAKEHYNNHLGMIYSWFSGDFHDNKENFRNFCIKNFVVPFDSMLAIDLGAGNGIQSIPLSELGFTVKAIDFNKTLLSELESNITNCNIEVIEDDILNFKNHVNVNPKLIVCCGDTLAHLSSLSKVEELLSSIYNSLVPSGKLILSFRDYSSDLKDTSRFIPVHSDDGKILTCFLEYYDDYVRVTDILHYLSNGKWLQKVSSYFKVRLTEKLIFEYLKETEFEILYNRIEKGMITLICQK